MSSTLEKFMAGIRKVESGGNYKAVGPPTPYGRATGAYQFIKPTWGNYKGYANAKDAPKSVQDARAEQLMSGYYKKFGRWDLVAVAWHAGEGTAAKVKKNPSALNGVGDVNMSTKKYAAAVLGAAGIKATTKPGSGGSGNSGGGGGGGGGSKPKRKKKKGDGKPGDVRTAWRLPRGVAGKGGKILIDTNHLLGLAKNMTGHLATIESVRRNGNLCEERVAKLRLTDQDQLPRIRKSLATALSDDYGVGRARWLLVRDIGYVVEARERALNADRTDAQERNVLDSLVASVGGGTTKAGRAKLKRLLAGLVPKNGRSGGGSNGGGSRPGSGSNGGGSRPGSGSNGGGSRPGSGSNPGSVGKGVGAKALAIARKEVGVKETSDNYSKRIHVYQKTTGAYRQAWCASFVNWAFRRAGKTVPGGGLAAVRTWVDLARQKKSGLKLVSAANARPGDLVAYDWGGGTDFGGDAHIGILASTPKGGRWTSLDGNTSADKVELKHRSSSMGNTVFIRVA